MIQCQWLIKNAMLIAENNVVKLLWIVRSKKITVILCKQLFWYSTEEIRAILRGGHMGLWTGPQFWGGLKNWTGEIKFKRQECWWSIEHEERFFLYFSSQKEGIPVVSTFSYTDILSSTPINSVMLNSAILFEIGKARYTPWKAEGGGGLEGGEWSASRLGCILLRGKNPR
jgi:hypothetical protein